MTARPARRRLRDRLPSRASAALYAACTLFGAALRYASLLLVSGIVLLENYGVDLGTPPPPLPRQYLEDLFLAVILAPAFETILMTLIFEPSAWLLGHAPIIPSAIVVIAAVQLHYDALPINAFVATTFAAFCVQYVYLRPRQCVA